MPGRPASRVAHSNCECIAHGRQCCELGVERCLAIQRLVLHTAVSQNATRGNNVAIAATRCRKSCRGEPSQDQLSPAMAQPPQAKLLSYEIHYTAFLLSVAVGFLAFMSHIRSHSAQSPAAATCIVSSVQCPVSRVRRWLVVWQCKMACRPGRTTSKLMQRTMLQKLLFAWLQQQHLLAAFRERRLLRPLGEPWRESEPQDRRPNLPGQARHRQASGQGCRCQSREPVLHGPRPHQVKQERRLLLLRLLLQQPQPLRSQHVLRLGAPLALGHRPRRHGAAAGSALQEQLHPRLPQQCTMGKLAHTAVQLLQQQQLVESVEERLS